MPVGEHTAATRARPHPSLAQPMHNSSFSAASHSPTHAAALSPPHGSGRRHADGGAKQRADWQLAREREERGLAVAATARADAAAARRRRRAFEAAGAAELDAAQRTPPQQQLSNLSVSIPSPSQDQGGGEYLTDGSFYSAISASSSPSRAAAAVASASTAAVAAEEEEEGLSVARLRQLEQYVQRQVEERRAPMMQLAVCRRGRLVFSTSAGAADLERGTELTDTTIVRMYSNTKMVVSAAAMVLVERAQLQLDTALEDILPCFSSMQVRTGPGKTRPAARKVTVQHLLTHTAGLTYSFMGGPLAKMYSEAGISFENSGLGGLGDSSWPAEEPGALRSMVERLAELPLLCDPGDEFHYSNATDVIGCVIEVVSCQLLGDFLRDGEEIFVPLGMEDTAFECAPHKQARLAANYSFEDGDEQGREGAQLQPAFKLLDDPATSGCLQPHRHICSGGGGLLSTLADWTRFLLAMSGGGALPNAPRSRILGRKTVEFMMQNQLQDGVEVASEERPLLHNRGGVGFGIGGAVVLSPQRNGCLGSVGQWSWGGAANTFACIDPQEELSFVLLTQVMPSFELCQWRRDLQTMIQACIVD